MMVKSPRPRIAVVGAGAAGLMAAAEAAIHGADVVLVEKNRKTGVKILMSGGTRCNLTHHAGPREMAKAFGGGDRFLQPSFGAFPPSAVVQLFHDLGVPTKVESTGKIFPVSNKALHVRDALERRAIESGVDIRRGAAVCSLSRLNQDDSPLWKVETEEEGFEVDRVIVTSGGRSWPGCGTTGDGYGWLSGLGHSIVQPRPALVPLVGGESWTHELSGVTLDDCVASVVDSGRAGSKAISRRRSSLLFTHVGFSGPAAMDVSGALTSASSFADRAVLLDMLPEINESELRQQLTDRSRDGGRARVSSLLGQYLPNRLATALVHRSDADLSVAELPKAKCSQLIASIKRLNLNITGTQGFAKAEVTAGGVTLAEVNPKTLESRLAPGLFIAGEVLDVDGPIGGYNFQAAFSTGRAAGIAAAST